MKKSLIILALCLTIGTAASAYDIVSVCPTGQRLGYNITSTNPPEVTLVECLDFEGGVTIPETLSFNFTDYTVVAIGEWAFNGACWSQNFSGPLVIPNTVRSIGARAFWDCWFTGPLVIPNSVTEIGEWAFFGCKKFTSLTLSESLSEIKENTFDGCENFRGDLVIPESVEYIGNQGFNGCGFDGTLFLSPKMAIVEGGCIWECYNFSAIKIPEGVMNIGFSAFEFLFRPTELELPSTLTDIEDYAFCNLVKLKQMTVHSTIPPYIWGDTFERVNHGIPVYIPIGTKEIYENAEYWSEFTNFIEVDFESVDEHDGFATAEAYPNPGLNTLNIITTAPNAQVEIYDMTGRLIHCQTAFEGTATIDAALWPSGVYAWRVVSEKKEETTGKWIKK
jgi:hypothetical protein